MSVYTLISTCIYSYIHIRERELPLLNFLNFLSKGKEWEEATLTMAGSLDGQEGQQISSPFVFMLLYLVVTEHMLAFSGADHHPASHQSHSH